jgi:hypothetical protein
MDRSGPLMRGNEAAAALLDAYLERADTRGLVRQPA